MEINRLNMQSLAEKKLAAYQDEGLALITSVNDLRNMPAAGVVVEGYLLGIVLSGQAQIIVESQEFSLKRGDIFVCNPRNMLERSMLSIDFEIVGLFMAPDYAEQMATELNMDWTLRAMAQTQEVIHCDEDEMNMLIGYVELLKQLMERPASEYKRKTQDTLLVSMAYVMFEIRQKNGEAKELPTRKFSSAEHLFQRFVKMLSEPGTPFLTVGEYAERLSITPKYFSAICKNITGKSASAIINEEVIRTAKILLHDSSKSVKQVADDLGFVNQSHFGAFFRRYTGTSPQRFRKTL